MRGLIQFESWMGREASGALDRADRADLAVATEAVLAGAREVLRRYRTGDPAEAEEKAPGDPVTEADRAADRAIHRVLERRRPGEAVLSEESVELVPAAPSAEENGRPDDAVEPGAPGGGGRGHLWVVDPLDGTKEFLARNGEFAVMVGLALDGRTRLGALFRPDPGVLYLGVVGLGAWRAELEDDLGEMMERADAREGVEEGDGNGEEEPDRPRPLLTLGSLSSPAALDAAGPSAGAVRLIHSRSHTPDDLDRLERELDEVRARPHGSSGLKCALVASGEADLYVHPVPYLKEWDTCAPEAVLRGAGGRCTDCLGEPLRYGKDDPSQPAGIFAARADVWERVRGSVAGLAP